MPLTYEAVLFEASALSATSFAAAFASASLPSRSSHPRYTSTDRVTHVALLSSTSFSVAAVIFWATTDSWTLSELSAVILAAVGFGVAEAVLLLPLRDVQQTYRRSDQRSAPRALGDGRSPEARGLNVVAAMSTAEECDVPRPDVCARSPLETPLEAPTPSSRDAVHTWVASLLAAQDVLTGLGSGTLVFDSDSTPHP